MHLLLHTKDISREYVENSTTYNMCECVCVLYLVNALTKDKESIESKFEITLKGEK